MDFLTIAGYVIAALAIALGLYLMLRKNVADQADEHFTPAQPALLDKQEMDRIPVVPRHLRQQLAGVSPNLAPENAPNTASSPSFVAAPSTPAPARTPPSDSDEDLLAQAPSITAARTDAALTDTALYEDHEPATSRPAPSSTVQPLAAQDSLTHAPAIDASPTSAGTEADPAQGAMLVQQAQTLADSSRPDQEAGEDAFDQALAQLEAVTAAEDTAPVVQNGTSHTASPQTDALTTADVEEWQGESALLDAHLQDQERRDDESALAQAEHIIALYVMPSPSRALSGERTIHLLRQFGLRYGEMSLFHRFKESDGTGPLMFSVLRYTSEGPSGFDLETLPSEQVEGLAFFLALPGKYALDGYDTMVSISTLLAREIGGQVLDEHMSQLSPQLRDHYRHVVLEYRSPR